MRDAVNSVRDAYSVAGSVWESGAGPVYNAVADALVACSPSSLTGALVLDLGAGTGAASRALSAVGAHPVAADVAFGMLSHDRSQRPPAAVADALALPFAPGSFDGIVAAFSLNHLVDPVVGLVEAMRVVRRGGVLLASAYGAGDRHPAKDAVDRALRERGWDRPDWCEHLYRDAVPKLATEQGMQAAAAAAGIPQAQATCVDVEVPGLSPVDLVMWRLGMAACAGFVTELDSANRSALVDRALELLGADVPVLVRQMIVLIATQR